MDALCAPAKACAFFGFVCGIIGDVKGDDEDSAAPSDASREGPLG